MKIKLYLFITLCIIYSCSNDSPNVKEVSEDTSKIFPYLFLVDTIDIVDPVVVRLNYLNEKTEKFQTILISKRNFDSLNTIDFQTLIKSGGIIFVMPYSFSCLLSNLLYDSSSTAFTSMYLNLQAQYRGSEEDTIYRLYPQYERDFYNFDKPWVIHEILPTKFLVWNVSNNIFRYCQSMERKPFQGYIVNIAVPFPKIRT